MRGGTRYEWVDILRAFAVICIVLGHTLRNATAVYPWLYSFHVPLCVMTSGIVFHRGRKRFVEFVKNKFLTLMIPYYCFAVISIALYAVLGDMMEASLDGGYNVSIWQSLWGMLYANSGTGLMRWNMPLWYLPMLFGLVVIAWAVYKDEQSIAKDWIILASSVMIAVLCYSVLKLDDFPFGLETALSLFPFFAIGRLIGRYQKALDRIHQRTILFVGVFMVLLGTAMTIGNGQISYNADSYGQRGFLYFIIMSSTLCIGFALLSKFVKRGIKWMTYVGQNTIGIMVMHKFPILFFVGLVPVTKRLNSEYPLPGAVLIASISIALCLIASEVIYRVCPLVLGKIQERKRSV